MKENIMKPIPIGFDKLLKIKTKIKRFDTNKKNRKINMQKILKTGVYHEDN